MKYIFKKFSHLLLSIFTIIVFVGCVKTSEYTVTFNLMDAPGEIEAQVIEENGRVTKPDDPVWDEYEFGGWYLDSSFLNDKIWIFSVNVVTEDITLYAKWDETATEIEDEFIIPTMPNLAIRDAKGNNGMVASASGYASEVGAKILEAGGNAFDAAVAIGFVLNVVEPNASGVGGGGFMVAYNSETDTRLSYNYREFAPGLADRSQYSGGGSSGTLSLGDGAGSFGIPMMVDGMLTVLEEQGTMDLIDVMQPAIDLAYHGFPITEALAAAISDNYSKIMRPTAIDEALPVYTDGLMPLGEGDLLVNKNLAKVLEKIALEGKEGFYKGEVARAIVNSVRSEGSVATLSDFEAAIGRTAGAHAQVPVTGTYKNYEIISMSPPSSGGSTLIEIFNMLEHFDKTTEGGIAGLGHNTADYIHTVGSATQLAFGDRRKFIGDPNFVDVPVQGLISKDFAVERWSNFNPLVGQTFGGAGVEYGDPWKYEPYKIEAANVIVDENQSASTTHFSVIDKFGNIVSATHTINYFFGNGHMPTGTGIHLNNIMSPFSLNESSVNIIKPFKVPISNMSPTIVLMDGEPFMSIGSPGSMRITSAIVQTMLNIMEFDMDIQTAIESPRVHHYVASVMEIEGAIGEETINGLKALGYNPTVYKNTNLYFGGVQGILINPETKELHGGADPRRDGKAIGY